MLGVVAAEPAALWSVELGVVAADPVVLWLGGTEAVLPALASLVVAGGVLGVVAEAPAAL